MEREAESWFGEDSVASAKLSIAESLDDTLFNFGIEVNQIDSKEPPIWSDEETEADKLDKIMNIVNESDNDNETSDGEVSFSLSLLEANAQAQREAGLARQTKDNQVVEEHAEVEITSFFLWQCSQDETEDSREQQKAPASSVVPDERKEPATSEEEDAGSDITSIFMWDENKFVNDKRQEKQEAGQAAIESSLESPKILVAKIKEEPSEQRESEDPTSSGEGGTTSEEAILGADYKVERFDTSGKSELIAESNKKEEDFEMTEDSEAKGTYDSHSKVQDALLHGTDESIEASGYEDFIKGFFVQNKSESESEVDDKYGIPEPASSESEVNDGDKYNKTNDLSIAEAADYGDNFTNSVSGAASKVTEHSNEFLLDAGVNLLVESDVAKDLPESNDGATADAFLVRAISSNGSGERRMQSFEGTIESSAMGTDFQSTFEDTTLYSDDGTMGITLDGNESSLYDGAAATLTSYGTGGSTILDSSFSDDFDDPLNKMLDFAGCMAATCEDENASLSGDRSSKKKKSLSKEQSNATGERSPGVLTMLADYMKKETPCKNLAQKAAEEEPPRAPLSPRNTSIKSPTIDHGKTPRHANKSIQNESLSGAPAIETVDPTVQDVSAAPVGTSSGEAGDENAPIETVYTGADTSINTGADTSINTGTYVSSVNTGADTVRAGFQSMQLRNKILSGARQKMESAMISRHQRAGLQEFAEMKRSSLIPRKPFPSIGEDTDCKDASKDMAAVRRNRWRKQDREFLAKKKSRRRNKKQHKASKTVDTKHQ